jgi:hypothetical protein
MTWTLCSSGAAIAKAGTHANSAVIASAATLLEWCTEAEGFICAECHNDFITNYTSQNNQIKNALKQACSSMIAMNIISFDNTGYLTREADTLMNNNYEMYSQSLKYLSIKQNQTLN